jgi:hypothetical protein
MLSLNFKLQKCSACQDLQKSSTVIKNEKYKNFENLMKKGKYNANPK